MSIDSTSLESIWTHLKAEHRIQLITTKSELNKKLFMFEFVVTKS